MHHATPHAAIADGPVTGRANASALPIGTSTSAGTAMRKMLATRQPHACDRIHKRRSDDVKYP